MNKTGIAWTNLSWNPTTGCSRVSRACDGCYAEALSLRRGWSTLPWTAANAAQNVKLHPERLTQPMRQRRPSHVFVGSVSDLFHDQVPDDFRAEIFAVMRQCPRHTFQVLTKRPERMAGWTDWPINVWAGVTVEDTKQLWRLDVVRSVPARVRWVSIEPLFEDLGDIDLSGFHWVVVGGYAGPGWRENGMDHAWALAIRDQCRDQGLAFFFKQSSGFRTGMGVELIEADGTRRQCREYPEVG